MDLVPPSHTAPFLPLIRTTGLNLGVFALHSMFFYSDTPLPRRPYSRLAQVIFEPKVFPYKYPNNIVPVILPAYTTYKDGTECPETSACKIQIPRNHPKERIKHSENLK
jgi:hypothetical protein